MPRISTRVTENVKYVAVPGHALGIMPIKIELEKPINGIAAPIQLRELCTGKDTEHGTKAKLLLGLIGTLSSVNSGT